MQLPERLYFELSSVFVTDGYLHGSLLFLSFEWKLRVIVRILYLTQAGLTYKAKVGRVILDRELADLLQSKQDRYILTSLTAVLISIVKLVAMARYYSLEL